MKPIAISDKVIVFIDKFSNFPIHITTQMKNEESLFYIQLTKGEAYELIEALTKSIAQL